MDNGKVSLPAPTPAPVASGLAPGQPGLAPSYPSENPFGDRGHRDGPVRNLRKRISSALAALAALFAKFFAAIKGLLLLLPKAKLLTTAGTALVSVVLYSLFWGWWFAFGFVALCSCTRWDT